MSWSQLTHEIVSQSIGTHTHCNLNKHPTHTHTWQKANGITLRWMFASVCLHLSLSLLVTFTKMNKLRPISFSALWIRLQFTNKKPIQLAQPTKKSVVSFYRLLFRTLESWRTENNSARRLMNCKTTFNRHMPSWFVRSMWCCLPLLGR